MIRRASIYQRYAPAVREEGAADDECYWFVFSGGRLLADLEKGTIPCLKGLDELGIELLRVQFLGHLDGKPVYSAEVPPETAAPEGLVFSDLRSLYGVLEEDVFLLAGRAIQIVNWDQTYQYCGRCGHRTESMPEERAKRCPACGLLNFPRLSPAVITAVIRDDKILLSHYAASRSNMHTIIAGFVEPGETLEECVRREVLEETGVLVKNIRYFGSQPWPFPNSLMIGFTAEYESGEVQADGREISEAGWYGIDDMPDLPPEMSIAREIINWFIENRSEG